MMKACIIKYFVILTAITSLFFTGDTNINAQNNDVVVICPASVGSLSPDQIKNIFSGNINKWPGKGGDIQVIFNKDKNLMNQFCSKYMQISYTSLNNLWVKKSISDGVATPREMPSNVVVTMVGNSEKFIGVVLRSEAGTAVKILE